MWQTACWAQQSSGSSLDGLPAGVLRRAVVAALLQAEGGHAEQEAVSGVVSGVGRERAGDAAAQIVPVAEEEVGEMADLERHHVARLVGDDAVEPRRHPVPVAGGPIRDRRDVGAFALRGRAREFVEAAKHRLDVGEHALLPQHGVHLGAEDMPRHEIRVIRQRPVDGLDRITPVALELAYRRLQDLQALGIGRRCRHAARVVQGHGIFPLRRREPKRSKPAIRRSVQPFQADGGAITRRSDATTGSRPARRRRRARL